MCVETSIVSWSHGSGGRIHASKSAPRMCSFATRSTGPLQWLFLLSHVVGSTVSRAAPEQMTMGTSSARGAVPTKRKSTSADRTTTRQSASAGSRAVTRSSEHPEPASTASHTLISASRLQEEDRFRKAPEQLFGAEDHIVYEFLQKVLKYKGGPRLVNDESNEICAVCHDRPLVEQQKMLAPGSAVSGDDVSAALAARMRTLELHASHCEVSAMKEPLRPKIHIHFCGHAVCDGCAAEEKRRQAEGKQQQKCFYCSAGSERDMLPMQRTEMLQREWPVTSSEQVHHPRSRRGGGVRTANERSVASWSSDDLPAPNGSCSSGDEACPEMHGERSHDDQARKTACRSHCPKWLKHPALTVAEVEKRFLSKFLHPVRARVGTRQALQPEKLSDTDRAELWKRLETYMERQKKEWTAFLRKEVHRRGQHGGKDLMYKILNEGPNAQADLQTTIFVRHQAMLKKVLENEAEALHWVLQMLIKNGSRPRGGPTDHLASLTALVTRMGLAETMPLHVARCMCLPMYCAAHVYVAAREGDPCAGVFFPLACDVSQALLISYVGLDWFNHLSVSAGPCEVFLPMLVTIALASGCCTSMRNNFVPPLTRAEELSMRGQHSVRTTELAQTSEENAPANEERDAVAVCLDRLPMLLPCYRCLRGPRLMAPYHRLRALLRQSREEPRRRELFARRRARERGGEEEMTGGTMSDDADDVERPAPVYALEEQDAIDKLRDALSVRRNRDFRRELREDKNFAAVEMYVTKIARRNGTSVARLLPLDDLFALNLLEDLHYALRWKDETAPR
ncbi:unnamed protein product [Amoebophrya sp. A120]|nr:unnamed protein product [Amoebophrya sp. A120]|eukprot:GSA120T00004206001.1